MITNQSYSITGPNQQFATISLALGREFDPHRPIHHRPYRPTGRISKIRKSP
jgi:hypothetical protein